MNFVTKKILCLVARGNQASLKTLKLKNKHFPNLTISEPQFCFLHLTLRNL